MTHSTHSREGDQPLYKESGFWTRCVLPLLLAIGAGLGIGGIADHAMKDLEKEMQNDRPPVTAPAEAQPSAAELR